MASGCPYMVAKPSRPIVAPIGVDAAAVVGATTADEGVSRTISHLHPGAAITTFKNGVDRARIHQGVRAPGGAIEQRERIDDARRLGQAAICIICSKFFE